VYVEVLYCGLIYEGESVKVKQYQN